MIPGKMDLIKTATIRMVKITRITMKTVPTGASVGPEMAAPADMVKAAWDGGETVAPVVQAAQVPER